MIHHLVNILIKMAEVRENRDFKTRKEILIKELIEQGIPETEIPFMFQVLTNSILHEIDSTGRIPMYSFILFINNAEVYTNIYLETVLEITCNLKAEVNNVADIQTEGDILFPKSASARLNIESGDIANINVSWKEYELDRLPVENNI